jgi:hypothetical protein
VLTINQYYRSYRSVLGAISVLFWALPFVSLILPSSYAGCFFPPLGPFEPVARLLTVVFAAFATYVAYFLPWKRAGLTIAASALVFFVCILLYGWSFTSFVRVIQIESKQEAVSVSIGNERTEFASKNFPDKSDSEMLRLRGIREEEIERLWTMKSILLARFSLRAPYCCSIFVLLIALGIGIGAEVEKTHRYTKQQNG